MHFSKVCFIEIKSKNKAKITIRNNLYGESGLYILDGTITDNSTAFKSKHLLVAKDAKLCEFEIEEKSKTYIFGGEPLPEERYILWDFVSSSKEG